MYFMGNIELRKSKYYLFLLHVRSIHACPSIVRPFYVANHHPLYIASTSLANNSVSTRCCTHVRNQKGCDSEREGVRERERTRERERAPWEETRTREWRRNESRRNWCGKRSEQWLAVYNAARNESRMRLWKKWVRESGQRTIATKTWQWTTGCATAGACSNERQNERTNESACVCACVQVKEQEYTRDQKNLASSSDRVRNL